jgi:hypothetical protein
MKHTKARSRFAGALLAAAFSISLRAGNNQQPIETQWERVCSLAHGRELTLTTDQGETIQGYCVSVDVNRVAIRTTGSQGQRVVQISRSTLSKLEMQRPKAHQLASLGKGMRHELHEGVKQLFSPLAPAGMVLIPATLAWGAVATPFCILGDLFTPEDRKREIKVQP